MKCSELKKYQTYTGNDCDADECKFVCCDEDLF